MAERTDSQGFRNAVANRSALRKFSLGLPGPLSKALQVGKLLERDGVSHLEAEPEISGRLVDHAFEVTAAREKCNTPRPRRRS